MKTWYLNREAENLIHYSQFIAPGKKIYLTDDQAELHGEKVETTTDPASKAEAGSIEDYQEWEQAESAQSEDM